MSSSQEIQTITKDFGTNINKTILEEAKIENLYQAAPAKLEEAPAHQIKAEGEVGSVAVPKEKQRKDALERISARERALMQKEKLANEKLAKAEEFQRFFEQSKEDPKLIAKAYNMETGEFLTKIQNNILNIKDEPKKPEQVIQQRFDLLEEQTRNLAEANFKAQRNNYISQHILPVLLKEADKFQFINDKLDLYAPYMHDMIHNHWIDTGGEKGGEIWKTEDVAEELEKELTDQAEKQAIELKKNPKLKKYFKEEVEIEHIAPVSLKTITSSIGSNSSGGLPDFPKQNAEGTKIIYSETLDPKEAKRLRTAQAIAKQFPERFTRNKK